MKYNISSIYLFDIAYEYVQDRFRYKRSCQCVGFTTEDVEQWIKSIIPSIDFVSVTKVCPIDGISTLLTEQICNVEYSITKRRDDISKLQNEDNELWERLYHSNPSFIPIVSKRS